jgi:amino acid transporter
LYVLASYAFVVAFADPSALAGDNSPFVTASQRFAPFLAPLVVVALLTSISSSFVAANTEIARVVYNTAREGLLPRALGRLHLRYRTPAVAVVAFVAPSVVIALVASVFADALTAAGFVGTLGTLAVILMYAMTNVALIVHWARGEAGGERGSIFFRLVVPVVGLAILGVPLWYNLQPDQDPPYNTIPILLPLILLGGLAYMLWVQRSRPQLLEQAGSIIMGERPADEAAVPTKERT